MEFSDQQLPDGQDLIRLVISLTGLPGESVERELQGILNSLGCAPESLTMDQLRSAMLAYLENIHTDLDLHADSAPADTIPLRIKSQIE